MSFSNRTAQALLNSLFGKTSNFGALASRPTLYVGLSTSTPAEDGTGVTEPSGNGYARVATAPSDWNDATLADPSVVTNGNDVTFPAVTGVSQNWGVCTHVVVFDASSGGNVIGSGTLTTTKTPSSGDVPKFSAGELSITLD